MFDPFYLLVPFIILALITVLVAAHELGHYLFARLFGMGVEEFAIGFGKKPLWIWMRKTYRVDSSKGTTTNDHLDEAAVNTPTTETTNFTVRAWPLGGFVRIKGMVPEEDGSEVNVPGGFYSKAPWQRFVVLLMGPVFSILAGFALLIPLFMILGKEKGVNEPVFSRIEDKSPAARAGLKPGDRVLSIDGTPVATWYELVSNVRDKQSQKLLFKVRRGSSDLDFEITPELTKQPVPVIGPDMEPTDQMKVQARIGAAPKTFRVPVGFGEALGVAASMPVKMVASLAGVVQKPSTFKDQMGGPVSIVTIAAQQAREGIAQLISFAGVLSISLGIFNLLPIAPLDGGQMVVALVEMLRRGKRLSFRVQNWVAGVGLLLIFALVISVLAADISKFFPNSKEQSSATTQSK